MGESLGRMHARAVKVLRRGYALLLSRLYRVRFRGALWTRRHGGPLLVLLLVVIIPTSFYVLSPLRGWVEQYFGDQARLATLAGLLASLGASLIGASAIAFTLIVFAVQLNAERTPHGLFRKLSSDKKLLVACFATVFLSIGVSGCSLLFDKRWLPAMTLGAAWAVLLVLLILLYSYGRALHLINPVRQLDVVVADAVGDLRAWGRRAKRAAFLLESDDEPEKRSPAPHTSSLDLPRATFFRLNPHWTNGARQGLLYAMSIARTYSERGDQEVSRAAYEAALLINAAYIGTKGKTFFPTVPFLDADLSTDSFINYTLEQLRQDVGAAMARADEATITSTMRAAAALAGLYARIDYGSVRQSRFHAALAAAHLVNAVRQSASESMTDVTMEGVRLVGGIARELLAQGASGEAVQLAKNVSEVAGIAVRKGDSLAVTRVCAEQLAGLTAAVISTRVPDIGYVVRTLRESMVGLAQVVLALPDAPLQSVHSSHLGPYYSCTSSQSLAAALTELGNRVLQAGDEGKASSVVANMLAWADDLERAYQPLLQMAIKNGSMFALDLVQFGCQVAKVLLAVARAPMTKQRQQAELEQVAAALGSAPVLAVQSEAAVAFVQSFNLSDSLLEIGLEARNRGATDQTVSRIESAVLGWGFKAGKYPTGRGDLVNGLLAAAALAVAAGHDPARLRERLAQYLVGPDAPAQEMRVRAARDIRQRSRELESSQFAMSHIDRALGELEDAGMRPVLEAIADQLSNDGVP